MAAAAADSDSGSSSGRLGGVLRQFVCPLCEGYFRDPVITSCGHSFCHVCISRHWERCRDSFPCPECGAASPEIRLRPNRQLRNAVGSARSLPPRPRASRAARTARKVHRAPIDRLSIERSPEREPCRKRRRSGFPLIEEAPSVCPGHREPLGLFCSQDERPQHGSRPQHRGHDFLRIKNAFQKYQKYQVRTGSPVLWEKKCVAHMKALRKEREKLRQWKAMGKKYLKQTQAKQQKVVAEFQQSRSFLEEQERLLLAQMQNLDKEHVKHQAKRGRKLSEQNSHLSERIRKLEGKCQKPASEFQQDFRSTLSRCEEGQAQQPEEMPPELEERVQDFSQQTPALLESLRAFRDTLPAALEAQSGDLLGAYRPANVTLDPDMAHPNLVLSEDRKRVRQGETRQPQTNTRERSGTWPCVLGREGFTSGRHCWEVEVGDGRLWAVGVARESVSRKGGIRLSPKDGIWAVRRWWDQFQALTDPPNLFHSSPPSRIRVCLDCDRGQVTFIDAGTEAPIFTFPPGSLPGERIRPWLGIWGTNIELRLSL